jgi:dipeptidase D
MDFDLNKPWCRYFYELSQIPHPSRHEQQAAAWVLAFAQARNLETEQDDWGNTIVRKPASKGKENAASLMLQAHMDMVPSKDPGVGHDFEKDPLDLYVQDGFLKARGTSLGADDGVGVAVMMAMLDDENLVHPPLECVFTVREEIGLEGALHMKPGMIHSHRIISLDGGGETSTMCCAAGGIKGYVELSSRKTEARKANGLKVLLTGLAGGHSGLMIDQGRANAVVLCGRLLKHLDEIEVSSLSAGEADNSIADHACLVLNTDDPEKTRHAITQLVRQFQTEYAEGDPGLTLQIEDCPAAAAVYEEEVMHRLVDLITLMPCGVDQYSRQLAVPTTSNNLGLLEEAGRCWRLWFRTRGLLDSAMDHELDIIQAASRACGGFVKTIIRYPGWNYAEDSPLRTAFEETVQELYGKPCVVEGCHAGNETGIWAALQPGADIISIASIEEDFHTPKERLDLAAFDRLYHELTVLVEKLAQ